MKPESRSRYLLGVARSQAKMVELDVPEEYRLSPQREPSHLFPLAIGILGDVVSEVSRSNEPTRVLQDFHSELRFSAFFLDAYGNFSNDSRVKSFCLLLASAAYYLCDFPGSSAVLAKNVQPERFEGSDLATALTALLRSDFDEFHARGGSAISQQTSKALQAFAEFFQVGRRSEDVERVCQDIRNLAYEGGTPEELLLADVFAAIIKLRSVASSWNALPAFSGLSEEQWQTAIAKSGFIRELWPAQRLLGEAGLFKGESGVVQMPTSAGKTKANEIVIRASFLSGRATLAVIVAPFRALCHEIKDSLLKAFRGEDVAVTELSDVPQPDFVIEESPRPQVVVMTPEKLVYFIRHNQNFASRIGLLLYDEGHQFDSGMRGVIYELLLATLKRLVPGNCQVVLVSAVIPNAEAINKWLNGEGGKLVLGSSLLPVFRSIAYVNWKDILGQLQFQGDQEIGNYEFFVPRVIESTVLEKLHSRENERRFPERTDSKSVALYLGLKLVKRGAVAIFCGRKASVSKCCDTLADAYNRGLTLPSPDTVSVPEEVKRITSLVQEHLGPDSSITKCAARGVYTHHAGTPGGVRLAVEHAMKESLVNFVICTSTLAQGVNLPIRYLIVTDVYQGIKKISVRDFHNLMGRAGRSGMHTEGTVIFADPKLYTERNTREGRWRWNQVQGLLDPTKMEPSASSLLSLFTLRSDDGNNELPLSPLDLFDSLKTSTGGSAQFAEELAAELTHYGFSKDRLAVQLAERVRVFDALESYLMSALDGDGPVEESRIRDFARTTFAYSVASAEERAALETLFVRIAEYVMQQVPDRSRRVAYAKSLLGVRESQDIQSWTEANVEALEQSASDLELIDLLWPMFVRNIRNRAFLRCSDRSALLALTKSWIESRPFSEILTTFKRTGAKFGEGRGARQPTMDHMLELCENAIGFEIVLILAAVIETLNLQTISQEFLSSRLRNLQKRLKYGIRSITAIALHEMGFADRHIAGRLAEVLATEDTTRRELISALVIAQAQVNEVLSVYPAYFSFVYGNLMRSQQQAA